MKPFLKWAGGKTQLLNDLKSNIPSSYDRYLEPFVGGGAVLYSLAKPQALISDINPHLMNCYYTIKVNLDELIFELSLLSNTEKDFYKIREIDPYKLNYIKRAARFIYLNKTCFNGLYRENSKGKFNVPYGKYKNPKIIDKGNLLEINKYFNNNNVRIFCADYKLFLKQAKEKDFIYLDPPYHIVEKNSFTKYFNKDFKEKQQIELAKEFTRLDKLGCFLMLSNSDTDLINDLYVNYNKIKVVANRSINSKGGSRKSSANELIIKNY